MVEEGDARRAARPSRRLVAVTATLALLAGVSVAVGTRDSPETAAPGAPASTIAHGDRAPEGARPPDVRTAVEQLLRRRASAVLDGDRKRWMGTVDPEATAFRKRQSALFTRLDALPVTTWSYRLEKLGESGTRRTLDLRLSFRLKPDGLDTQRRQSWIVKRRAGRWYIAAAGDGQVDRDLWDLGPVRVYQGKRTLLVAAASRASRLAEYARDADRAIARVSAVWGDEWSRRVVVIVPGDTKQMATVLGRSSVTGLGKLAAVTTGAVERTGNGRSADRIVLNPKAFDSFTTLGRRVVLTHEVTHVVTRPAGTVSSPLWLDEGFADYVGFRGSGLTRTAIARSLVTQVRRGNGPTRLPVAKDFDPARGDVDTAYESAWLAMDMIDRQGGLARVLRFYRVAIGADRQRTAEGDADASKAALAAAFRSVLDTDQRGFERQWRRYQDELAGRTP